MFSSKKKKKQEVSDLVTQEIKNREVDIQNSVLQALNSVSEHYGSSAPVIIQNLQINIDIGGIKNGYASGGGAKVDIK